MSKIESFNFDKENFNELKEFEFGLNWPVVYILEDGKEAYIGETNSLYRRSKEHYELPERRKLKSIHVITDNEYNNSATLDIESELIKYIAADGKYILQNGNGGLGNYNYYNRVLYKTKFEIIWENLRDKGIVKNAISDLRNSDLFKYSPYKSLTDDQLDVAKKIYRDIKSKEKNTIIVSGKPGTGKTILATYLVKYLKEQEETKHLKVGLVVPMASLRQTISKVFSKIKGLKSNMVLGPNDVAKNDYDVLIVDESHRLQRRKGIMGYGAYDNVNTKLGLPKDTTQLDWITKCSKHQIFLYDPNQSIKPADIRPADFEKLNAKKYEITTQMRVEAGADFIDFIEHVFDLKQPQKINFPGYDFKIFDDVEHMVQEIKSKDKKHQLARVVAGYAWPWHTKNGEKDFDIQIGDIKLVWNSTAQDWVNSKNAINEVGCIHTVQGYDLNYVGVIIGPELSYDKVNNKFKVDKEKYFDTNGRNGITDPTELERYVINIYKTLLTRGIKGTYIYAVDESLREYLKSVVVTQKPEIKEVKKQQKEVVSPYTPIMVEIPLVGSAPCGGPLLGEQNIEDMIPVDKNKLRPGVQYFIVRAVGDSMNKAGINEGDLVLCRYAEKAETGDKVVALLGGEYVTIKYYDKKDGRRILLPKSTNPEHQPIIPEEGDMVQGVVQEIILNIKR